jgi:hypothetical protein
MNSDEQGMRTPENVKAELAEAKRHDADEVLARIMLRHFRLTDEAREYVAKYLVIRRIV